MESKDLQLRLLPFAVVAGTVRDPDGVQDKDDQPVPGATVVLIPETKRRAQHGLYQQTSTDQFGRYRFGSAAPGDCKLFAWADLEDGIWFDPDFLKGVESDGHSITVAAKDRQAVNLRLALGWK